MSQHASNVTRSDFLDVEAILAEEEAVPCTFNVDAFNLGFLDSTNSEQNPDLQSGTKAELPFWLAEVVAVRNMVQIQLPKRYSARFRSHLLADPLVMNLRERSPYYYQTGTKLSLHLNDRDSSMIIPALIRALSARYRDILDKSQNSRNEDVTEFTENLTELEKKLFDAGYFGSDELYKWKIRDFERLICFRPTKRQRR